MNVDMKSNTKGLIMLLATAFIWGTAFVAQRKGMEFIGPFTFNGIRSFIGAAVLIPVILFIRNSARRKDPDSPDALISPSSMKNLLKGGLACGVLMFTASSLQQAGMVYTTSGKAGFITALYIVIVPVLGLFIGKRVRPLIVICVAMAVCGLYLLTIKEGFSINRGDLLILACAFFFSLHILVIDHYSPRTNSVALSAIQLLVTGIISVPCIAIFETIDWSAVFDCAVPILYAGVMSCGVAYTMQIIAQKYTEPTIASLLLSLESVFAALAGAVVLGEVLSGRELAGCIIMFIAIILAQLPQRSKTEQ